MAKRKSTGKDAPTGTNGAGLPAAPTLDELRRAYDEGVPIRLLTGTPVQIRPVHLDRLLVKGKVPDALTPLVVRMLFGAKPDDAEFPDEIDDPVTHYLTKQRAEAQELAKFIESVDMVCEEALVDPALMPYLSLENRMWVFKMALLRAEVLSTFRHEPAGNVDDMAKGDEVREAA